MPSQPLTLQQVPLLWPAVGMSDAEAAAIKDLHANLCGIVFNVDAWRAALDLYQFAASRPAIVERSKARAWTFIAAHECVMQLRGLKERMEVIRGVKVKACPTIADSIDFQALRGAARNFERYFPKIESFRHAIAHAVDVDTNAALHAPSGTHGMVGFGRTDQFSAPFEGHYYNLDLTEATFDRVRDVAAQFLSGFAPAARKLEMLGHVDE